MCVEYWAIESFIYKFNCKFEDGELYVSLSPVEQIAEAVLSNSEPWKKPFFNFLENYPRLFWLLCERLSTQWVEGLISTTTNKWIWTDLFIGICAPQICTTRLELKNEAIRKISVTLIASLRTKVLHFRRNLISLGDMQDAFCVVLLHWIIGTLRFNCRLLFHYTKQRF